MSVTSIIIMAVGALVGLAGWLGAVFYAAREPRSGSARPGGEDPGRASQPEAGRHSGGALTRAGGG
jgi:hypothetical protein